MKRCTRCETAQPESEFHKSERCRDRLARWCKSCTSTRQREQRIARGLRVVLVKSKHCCKCGEDKPTAGFARNGRTNDGLASWCSRCTREASKRSAHDRRRRLGEIKRAAGCTDCGCADPDQLDFDHLPGFEKLFNLAEVVKHGWTAIEAEMAKCEVVCKDCHKERSQSRGQAQWGQLGRKRPIETGGAK